MSQAVKTKPEYLKLRPMGMVATPKDCKALENYLSRFYGSEAVVAMTCAGMAWNLACKLQEENEKSGWVKEGFDK
jgi:hypothetical protein